MQVSKEEHRALMAELGAIDAQEGAPIPSHPPRSPAACQASLLQRLPATFDDEQWSDASVEVAGGPPIHVHRLILALHSEPLAAMLAGETSWL
jgi:hypothetical protein